MRETVRLLSSLGECLTSKLQEDVPTDIVSSALDKTQAQSNSNDTRRSTSAQGLIDGGSTCADLLLKSVMVDVVDWEPSRAYAISRCSSKHAAITIVASLRQAC